MRDWLFNWQTLITGLLALAAGILTIWVTRRAAAEQVAIAQKQVAAGEEQLKYQKDNDEQSAAAAAAVLNTAREQVAAQNGELEYYKTRDAQRLADEERTRSRRQAEEVTAWLGEEEFLGEQMYRKFSVQNASRQLIYDAIVSLVSVQGAFRSTAVGDERNGPGSPGFQSLVGNVPPGVREARLDYPGGGMFLRFAVEIAFQDAGGRYWLRRGNGILEEVDQHPLALYGIPAPVTWQD